MFSSMKIYRWCGRYRELGDKIYCTYQGCENFDREIDNNYSCTHIYCPEIIDAYEGMINDLDERLLKLETLISENKLGTKKD